MITDLRVYVVITMFMIACIFLMILNFAIIHYSSHKSKSDHKKYEKWLNIIIKQTGKTPIAPAKHEQILLRKLTDTDSFFAYSHALHHLKSEIPKAYAYYIDDKHDVFEKLANIYGQKDYVRRAYYADFVCSFPELTGSSYSPIIDILISYIDTPDTNCLISVLKALCKIGNARGVVNLLQSINDKSFFVHHKLIANELSAFTGNKDVLITLLHGYGRNRGYGHNRGYRHSRGYGHNQGYVYSNSQQWNNNILVSIEEFAAETKASSPSEVSQQKKKRKQKPKKKTKGAR